MNYRGCHWDFHLYCFAMSHVSTLGRKLGPTNASRKAAGVGGGSPPDGEGNGSKRWEFGDACVTRKLLEQLKKRMTKTSKRHFDSTSANGNDRRKRGWATILPVDSVQVVRFIVPKRDISIDSLTMKTSRIFGWDSSSVVDGPALVRNKSSHVLDANALRG